MQKPFQFNHIRSKNRRRLVSSESCMIADPFQKDCILMPLHTYTKGSQAIPKLLTATSSWWFWAKTTTAIFVGEWAPPDETPFSKTVGHFQCATSSHWKKIWRNKFLKCAIVFCSNFWVMIFYPKIPTTCLSAKRKKVDLPGKIQVVINFHQLETPYNQQSSSL